MDLVAFRRPYFCRPGFGIIDSIPFWVVSPILFKKKKDLEILLVCVSRRSTFQNVEKTRRDFAGYVTVHAFAG